MLRFECQLYHAGLEGWIGGGGLPSSAQHGAPLQAAMVALVGYWGRWCTVPGDAAGGTGVGGGDVKLQILLGSSAWRWWAREYTRPFTRPPINTWDMDKGRCSGGQWWGRKGARWCEVHEQGGVVVVPGRRRAGARRPTLCQQPPQRERTRLSRCPNWRRCPAPRCPWRQ